jgi:DNA polymerase III sliding clamp (beta) subunit (PCNA family)
MRAEIPITELRAALTSVVCAASSDRERPSMNSVCFDLDMPTPKAMATDGTWFAERQFEAIVDTAGRAAISSNRAKKLLAMLADEEGTVVIATDDTLVRFEIEKVGRLDCDPVEGFPPLDRVWPNGNGVRMSSIGMNPKLLAKIGKAFACKKGHGIHFDFHGENTAIVVKSESTPEMRVAIMPMKQLKIEFSGADDTTPAPPAAAADTSDTERPPARGKSKAKPKANGKAARARA